MRGNIQMYISAGKLVLMVREIKYAGKLIITELDYPYLEQRLLD